MFTDYVCHDKALILMATFELYFFNILKEIIIVFLFKFSLKNYFGARILIINCLRKRLSSVVLCFSLLNNVMK